MCWSLRRGTPAALHDLKQEVHATRLASLLWTREEQRAVQKKINGALAWLRTDSEDGRGVMNLNHLKLHLGLNY
jgi:hypothetical protein